MHSFCRLLSKLPVALGCSVGRACGTGEELWQQRSCGRGPHRDGGSVPTVLPCLSVQRGLFSCRVVVGAHMQTMILCGGLAYKTKQMAHPLTVAWGPCASQAAFAVAIWQCGLVACTSCAVPACDLVCSEFNTSLVAGQMMIVCPQAISVKLEWPCTDGILFEMHLFSNDFHSHQVLRHVKTFCLHTSSSVHLYTAEPGTSVLALLVMVTFSSEALLS